MEEVEYRAVYTDLDSLLDTRIATIILANENLSKRLIETGTYLHRDTDVFELDGELISISSYDYLYRLRKPRILTVAPPTNVINIATKVIIDYNLSADINNPNNHFKIIVNTYPYNLTMMDSTILMGKFNGLVGNLADVKMIYMEPDKLSLEYFKDNNINTVILYDGFSLISRMIIKSGILQDGNIGNINFLTNKPRFPLSKNNKIIHNDYKYPFDLEELKGIMSMTIPTTFLDDFIFSYVPLE